MALTCLVYVLNLCWCSSRLDVISSITHCVGLHFWRL